MGTYYGLRCNKCKEQGGFFSRQAWGWGNADIIENTVFLMAHAECFNKYQGEENEHLEIISEYDWGYRKDEEILWWYENLNNPDSIAANAFPKSKDWDVADIRAHWEKIKLHYKTDADRIRENLEIQEKSRQERIEAIKNVQKIHAEELQKRNDACIAIGGHWFDENPFEIISYDKGESIAQTIKADNKFCKACGCDGKGGAVI